MPVNKDTPEPNKPTPRTRQPRPEKPADKQDGKRGEIDPMLKRHMDADAASLELRLETMAHALIYDITSLRDVVTRLHAMGNVDDKGKVIDRFFKYYVPRLEVLLEEDHLLGNISALSDLGEWLILDFSSNGELRHYQTILDMLSKPIEPTPVQLAKLLERSATFERQEPSRGEAWIPKSSRRASTL